MHMTPLTTGAAVLLAFVPSAFAGSARVFNNCGIAVYYASVAQNSWPPMALLPPGGYSEAYSGEGNGVSLKLSPFHASTVVTQFEFTLSGGSVSYDMSNINGNPFAAGGMSLTPSTGPSSDFPTCVPVNCTAGAAVCAAAYNQPDDTRTLVCGAGTDLTLTLCPEVPMKRDTNSAHSHRSHMRHFPKA